MDGRRQDTGTTNRVPEADRQRRLTSLRCPREEDSATTGDTCAGPPAGTVQVMSLAARFQAPLGALLAGSLLDVRRVGFGRSILVHGPFRVPRSALFVGPGVLALAVIGLAMGQPLGVVAAGALTAVIAYDRAVVRRMREAADDLRRELAIERRQHQLVQAARLEASSELAEGVAHEVNNPLTSVLGYTDLLLAELPAGSPQRADLEVIRSEADRAGAIVRSLLDFARPRSPRLAAVDLEEMVRACVEVVRGQAGRSGVRVVESYVALPLLALDAAAIQETILALLANALAAMPNGGTLRVTIVSDAHGALARVEDDGVGIDEDTLARAFRPFFSRRGGRGLGLSVARGLVEAHGGTIVLASAAGGGTMAEVRLPFVAGSLDAPAA